MEKTKYFPQVFISISGRKKTEVAEKVDASQYTVSKDITDFCNEAGTGNGSAGRPCEVTLLETVVRILQDAYLRSKGTTNSKL